MKIFLLITLAFGLQFAQASDIKFKHDIGLSKMLELAAKENKIIFIDAYTTWCGPCNYMTKEVFTEKEVSKFFNDNFINVKLDMESDIGQAFNQQLPVVAYPTLIFIGPEGDLLRKEEGARDAAELLELAQMVIDPSKDPVNGLMERYNEGEREVNFLIELASVMADRRLEIDSIVAEYWDIKGEFVDFENEGDVLMFYFEDSELGDTNVDLWMDHVELAWEALGEQAYWNKIKEVIFAYIENNTNGTNKEEELAPLFIFMDTVISIDEEVELETLKSQVRDIYDSKYE